ncbi:MAG: conserved hypothetical protein [uncultured Paraburkholderia sp.]|nr:MAG: conserved hypothetical protein [uncultured Paraburkholderia sp.]
MDCSFQIFTDGQWVDCAELHVHGSGKSTFVYDTRFAFAHSECVSLKYPVTVDEYEREGLPAFFYDLIPQGDGRKFLLGELQLGDGPDADFRLACAGAFNPIGRLRIAEAVDFFQQHVARYEPRDEGLRLEDIAGRSEDFTETMHIHGMLAGGTTGVQGAAPKFLLTKARDGLWYGDGILPDKHATAHYIVKGPRGRAEADRKVLRNEAAYMGVARALGIRTYAALELVGQMLFIPRFDREVKGETVIRHHQESVASIANLAGFGLTASLFDIVKAIRAVVTDPTAETIEFIKRDVLNLAMANKDNHARNTAVQIVGGSVALTPLFDFAPMFLDPEGIPRVLRWFDPNTRRELNDWGAIMTALALEPAEDERVRAELALFGSELGRLADIMAAEGVDDDIIQFCRQAMQTQAAQLQNLA